MAQRSLGTSASFKDASALNLPLSSHGKDHAPSLARGNACLTCRDRKIRCDSLRPACTACLKSARAHGEEEGSIRCSYDEADSRGEKRKRGAGSAGQIASLSSRIAELEAQLEEQAQQHQQQQQHRQVSPPPASTSSYTHPHEFPSLMHSNFDVLLEASGQVRSTSDFYFPPPAAPFVLAPSPFLKSPPDSYLDMLYPGWPRDLPTPLLTYSLIQIYFDKFATVSPLVSKQKFVISMNFPPMDPRFPSVGLIHAMLASVSRVVSESAFSGEARYWSGYAGPVDYHHARAKVAIDIAIGSGQHLFQTAQAIVLLCFVAYTGAKFIEVWMLCGLATRLILPLGLNHIRPSPAPLPNSQMFKYSAEGRPSLLPATEDEGELHERSCTFWLAFICDRYASASTGWALSLSEADITSLLPSAGPVYSIDDPRSDPLNPHSPTFFTSHPPAIVQSLQLYIKSILLLGRVVGFMQSVTTAEISLGSAASLRSTPAFDTLAADLLGFRATTSSLRENNSGTLSIVKVVPWAATILLHENFATMESDGHHDLMLAEESARCILDSIYGLWTTSFEITLVSPFLLWNWVVAGRTLVRRLAIQNVQGSSEGVVQLRADIGMIIRAMRANRSPLGDSMGASLQNLFENPHVCLPRLNSRSPRSLAVIGCVKAESKPQDSMPSLDSRDFYNSLHLPAFMDQGDRPDDGRL